MDWLIGTLSEVEFESSALIPNPSPPNPKDFPMKTIQRTFSEIKVGDQVRISTSDFVTITARKYDSESCIIAYVDCSGDIQITTFRGLVTCIDWDVIWEHFDRLQQRIMAYETSREDFFAESVDERLKFYEWMQTQAGEFSCHM